MSNINKLVQEALTTGDIATNIMGNRYIGRKMLNTPDEPIDPRKISHRAGILMGNPSHAIASTLAGITAGNIYAFTRAKELHLPKEEAYDLIDKSVTIGGLAGLAIPAGIAAYRAAKKLGYGKFGQVASGLSGGIPVAAPFTPDKYKK